MSWSSLPSFATDRSLRERPDEGWERRIALHLPGLSCRACARRAEDVLRRVPGVLAATVRLFRERADVRFDARRTSTSDLAAAMGRAGFAVAEIRRQPSSEPLAVDLGVGLVALANLMFLRGAGGSASGLMVGARIALAAVAVVVAGAVPARRAIVLLRRGILDRDTFAGVAVVACFAAGILDAVAARGALVPLGGLGAEPPSWLRWLAALGVGARAWRGARGAGFESAAAIAVAALVARAAEAALHRRALRDVAARERRLGATTPRIDDAGEEHAAMGADLADGDRVRIREGEAAPADLHLDGPARVVAPSPGGQLVARPAHAGEVMPRGAVLLSGEVTGRVVAGPGDLAAGLDAAVHAALARLAAARREPAPGTWDDAAVRGLFTAALACASFALMTHAWLGAGPLGPRAIFSAAAVLAGVSPAAILAAGPAARAVAVLRARAAGIVVGDAGALEALARVDTVCFAPSAGAAGATSAHRLRVRGIRALVIRGDHPQAIRDLQIAGARVLLVGDSRREPGSAAQADVAVAVAPGALPGAAPAPIVVAEGHLDDLAGLVDLGRALRAVIGENVALAAVYNAAVLPAAALGYVSPLDAAALVLGETLLCLANAARLLYRPSLAGSRD